MASANSPAVIDERKVIAPPEPVRDAVGSGSMTGGGIGHVQFPSAIGARLTMIGALALAACQPPPDERQLVDSDSAARGRAVIDRVKCAACHEIPGIDWPEGRLGPSLIGFDDVGLIAGSLPNRPGVLADFVRNAPAVKPGSTMPAIPISESESRDVAAYLYAVGDD